MPKKTINFKVGLFVLVSMSLLLFALFFWGVQRYIGDTSTYVTFFNQDVSGLSKDTPVKFRGVTVGRIEDISLAPDGILIEVRLGLSSDFKVTTNQYARIMSGGITGMKYLGIEFSTNATKEVILDFTPKYKVIPSRPSPGISDLLIEFQKQLQAVNLKEISAGITQALYQVNEVLSDKNWIATVSNINHIAFVSRKFSDIIQNYIDSGRLTNLINDSLAITLRARKIVQRIDPEKTELLISELTELSQTLNSSAYIVESNLQPMLQDLKQTINNLRSFSEALKDRPSQTLFSKPPEEEK